jgi:hypothetical protein
MAQPLTPQLQDIQLQGSQRLSPSQSQMHTPIRITREATQQSGTAVVAGVTKISA